MNKKALTGILIISLFQLTGCATSVMPEKMTVADQSAAQKPNNKSLINNIAVKEVSGGNENPIEKSKINNENLKQAIEQSLKNTNLYSNNAKYNLDVTLVNIKQPSFGINSRVVCKIHYLLQSTSLNKPLFDKDITTVYVATGGDAFVGAQRRKVANEGAIRTNITEFVKELYQLPVG